MSAFAVIRKEGGFDHLSLFSGDEDGDGFSVVKSLHLPNSFDIDENLYGGSCGEWSYLLYSCKGDILLWNSITPNSIRLLSPEPLSHFPDTQMTAIGVGYVAKSHHYKVIRCCVDRRVTTYSRSNAHLESNAHFEVCILEHPCRCPEWKIIDAPAIRSDFRGGAAVYLNATGRCYWTALYNYLDRSEFQSAIELATTGASPDSQFEFVVSFDFATERFQRFPLPATDLGGKPSYKRVVLGVKPSSCVKPSYKLVVCHGSLGALVYHDIDPSSPYGGLSIQLHLWSLKKRSWKLLYAVSHLAHVARPISGGLKDNRFMFLESKPIDGRSQLLVYDLKTKTEEKLDIYDKPGFMNGFSYAEREEEGEEEEEEEAEETTFPAALNKESQGMNVYAVICKEKAGCDNISFICGDGLSVVKNLRLPHTFVWDESVCGGSCGEWAYVYGFEKGVTLYWNLITPPQPQEIKFLDPPNFVEQNETRMMAIGMGYDAKSDHYKVMRYYYEGYEIENHSEHFEVCILEHDSRPPEWKQIEGPDFCSWFTGAGVYLNATGRCYWNGNDYDSLSDFESRAAATTFGSPINRFQLVVSYDFDTERFDKLPLPAATDLGEETRCALVVYHGSLGALVYEAFCPASCPGLSIQLHVWSLEKGKWAWKLLYEVETLAHVALPLYGLKDDRFMFLESKPRDGRSQLLAYDLKDKKVEKLDIYDRPSFMCGFSYLESSGPPLPV